MKLKTMEKQLKIVKKVKIKEFFLLGTDKTYSVDISFLTSKERLLTCNDILIY